MLATNSTLKVQALQHRKLLREQQAQEEYIEELEQALLDLKEAAATAAAKEEEMNSQQQKRGLWKRVKGIVVKD